MIRYLTPSRVNSLADRLRVCKFSILLSIKLKTLSIACKPRSPIPLPLRLTSSTIELRAPSKNVCTPSANNSLSYKLIFFRFLLVSTYFLRVGPIDDFMKFFPKSKEERFTAFKRIYSAPSVFIRFYDIFS